ncbi:MAG: hypothetical protein ACLSHC_16805 [Bilophila wadsworthia]
MDLYAFFQSEVKPTIGCTEPGAVAYAAAVAARHLPTQPEGIRLEMSVAIYKNGRSVGIPGTNGLRGLTLACVLGALGGNPDKGLMALEDIPADTVEQAQAFIDAGKMAEEVVQGTPSMWARVTLRAAGIPSPARWPASTTMSNGLWRTGRSSSISRWKRKAAAWTGRMSLRPCILRSCGTSRSVIDATPSCGRCSKARG